VSRRTLKKLLLSLVTIGALASITTGGTYAVFQSEEDNLNSNTASGTLTLSNQVGTGTICISQNGSGSTASGTENYNTKESSPASTGCDALFSTSTLYYPGTLVQIHVTLKNTGSVDGAKLSVFMPHLTDGKSCDTSTTTGATIIGTGDPCSATTPDLFYVEEDNSSWSPVWCQYDGTAPGARACSITNGGTLNNFAANYFTYATGGSPLYLGLEPGQAVALKAQDSRYFTIGIQEGSDNSLQGKTATFSLAWHLDSN